MDAEKWLVCSPFLLYSRECTLSAVTDSGIHLRGKVQAVYEKVYTAMKMEKFRERKLTKKGEVRVFKMN